VNFFEFSSENACNHYFAAMVSEASHDFLSPVLKCFQSVL
jgi:hypothetical protein